MKATFAGGCFWCMEPPFAKLEGVEEVIPGYSGGDKPNPTYEEVCSGNTGHREVVQIIYDEKRISYEELLDVFWKQIDPFDNGGQFADRGEQYMTAIFYHDEKQKEAAIKSKEEHEKMLNKEFKTDILPFKSFYPAEEYHKQYYKKNPIRYKTYKVLSGRESFLKKTWS